MKRILLLLVLCLFALDIKAQKQEIYRDTIPFRMDLGIMIIPISFNGVEKEFMFDTGAEISLGYSWVKDELKPTSKSNVVTSSNGSKTRMRYYKSGVISLGSRKIRKHRILGRKGTDIFSCYNIDGVLGVDIIRHFNWTIDFKNQILIMSPTSFYPEEVAEMHKLDFDFRNRPYVFMEMNNKKIKFLLDTGASHSDINKDQYVFTKIDQFPKVNSYSGFYDFNGTLTRTISTVLKLPEISSAEVKIKPTIYYDKKSTKIGNSLWNDQRLFMSLAKDELYVADGIIENEIFIYDCTAIVDNGEMVVLGIKENGEAWNLGIRQGDIVRSINGKIFTDFCTLNKYQKECRLNGENIEMLFADGKKITNQRAKLIKQP